MKNSVYNLVVVALVTLTYGGVILASRPIIITQGNVDPNGKLLWSFENGGYYVLTKDIVNGIRIENVNFVQVYMNGFMIKGRGTVTSNKKTEGCFVQSACGGNISSIPSSWCITQQCCEASGGTWNGSKCSSGKNVPCSHIPVVGGCESIGCVTSYTCPDIGLAISNSKNIIISNGRILGFHVGVLVTNSSNITISNITAITSKQPIAVQSSLGPVDVKDCIFGTTKGTTAGSFFIGGAGSVILTDCVFVGGKVNSNSKMVVLADCEFAPADGAVFTEVRNGVEVNRALAGLPLDFDVKAFVAHLEKTGVMFVGTSWCNFCKQQKAMFGDTSIAGIYFDVTMKDNDPVGNVEKKDAMEKLGIKSFPTWLIGGKTYPGLKSLVDLVTLTGYER